MSGPSALDSGLLSGRGMRNLLRRTATASIVPTLLALGLMALVFSLLAPSKFNSMSNLVSVAQNVSILLVIAVGTTFVIITGGIDLSIPAGVVLGEVMAVKAVQWIMTAETGSFSPGMAADEAPWYLPAVAALAGTLAGALLGAMNGFAVTRLRVSPLIATLGTLAAGYGVAQLLQDGVNTATYALEGVGYGRWVGNVPNLIVISAVVAVFGSILLHFTVFGRHTFAVGSNEESARRAGINTRSHLMQVYLLGGATAGFAGFLSLAYYSTTAIGSHLTDNLQAITAVALGGTSLFGGVGSILGTVVGVWIPAVLKNGFVIVGLQPYWQEVTVGIVLIVTVWADQLRRVRQLRR